MKSIIYIILDPITYEIRYVGKTNTSLNNRSKAHIKESQRREKDGTPCDLSHKYNWIREVIKNRSTPIFKILQEFNSISEADLNKAEKYWIKYFRKMGCPLTNLTDGGEGCLGLKHSNETKRILSEKSINQINKNTEKMIEYTKNNKDKKSKLVKKYFEDNPNKKIELSRKFGGTSIKDQYDNVYPTVSEAARKLNLERCNIRKVLNGKLKTTGGYHFIRLKELKEDK